MVAQNPCLLDQFLQTSWIGPLLRPTTLLPRTQQLRAPGAALYDLLA